MKLCEAYDYGISTLKTAGIKEAEVDAWYLLEYVTGVNRAAYFMNREQVMTDEQKEVYLACVDRRKNRIPLQHITGVQCFMGLDFEVNRHVLVPRQDTEVLVEEALGRLDENMHVLDMCTGSGCILISLLKSGKKLTGTGVDISADALDVARRNADRHQIKAEWIQSDLFTKVNGMYDMIVSNPPYIPTAVIGQLMQEVRLHDPYQALDGKDDGLYFYRRIIEESVRYIRDGGHLCFEIGHDQKDQVCRMMEEAGYHDVICKKDPAGLDRVVCGVYND